LGSVFSTAASHAKSAAGPFSDSVHRCEATFWTLPVLYALHDVAVADPAAARNLRWCCPSAAKTKSDLRKEAGCDRAGDRLVPSKDQPKVTVTPSLGRVKRSSRGWCQLWPGPICGEVRHVRHAHPRIATRWRKWSPLRITQRAETLSERRDKRSAVRQPTVNTGPHPTDLPGLRLGRVELRRGRPARSAGSSPGAYRKCRRARGCLAHRQGRTRPGRWRCGRQVISSLTDFVHGGSV